MRGRGRALFGRRKPVRCLSSPCFQHITRRVIGLSTRSLNCHYSYPTQKPMKYATIDAGHGELPRRRSDPSSSSTTSFWNMQAFEITNLSKGRRSLENRTSSSLLSGAGPGPAHGSGGPNPNEKTACTESGPQGAPIWRCCANIPGVAPDLKEHELSL